ncbi:hypothetical protein GC197_08955 [bacterium]|nr:hypothetical protein [bacterium]
MAFNMENINSSMNTTLDSLGADISSQTSNTNGGEMSEVQLMQLQQSMQKWSIMVNMHTNIQKTWSDAMKAIVQNMR